MPGQILWLVLLHCSTMGIPCSTTHPEWKWRTSRLFLSSLKPSAPCATTTSFLRQSPAWSRVIVKACGICLNSSWRGILGITLRRSGWNLSRWLYGKGRLGCLKGKSCWERAEKYGFSLSILLQEYSFQPRSSSIAGNVIEMPIWNRSRKVALFPPLARWLEPVEKGFSE